MEHTKAPNHSHCWHEDKLVPELVFWPHHQHLRKRKLSMCHHDNPTVHIHLFNHQIKAQILKIIKDSIAKQIKMGKTADIIAAYSFQNKLDELIFIHKLT